MADDKLSLSRIAGLHADRQLRFGGPFWAESVLAGVGATDDFRYVHRDAFDVSGLDEVFAADGAHDVVVWIHDAGSAAAAQRVYQRIESAANQLRAEVASHAADGEGPAGGESYAAEGGDAGQATGGVRHQGAVTIIPRGDGVLAFFTHGQYVQGTFGKDEDTVVKTAAGAHEAAMSEVVQTRVAAAPSASAEDDNPFPEPDDRNWQRPRQVDRFTAETLYMKINGRADAYLQFSVEGLAFGTYTHRRAADRTIDVYMYAMGGPENAYGIYKTEFAPSGTATDVGQEGYTVDGAVFFHKGAYYVQVLPSAPEDGAAARAIAEAIAATIADVDNVPWAEQVLPTAGRRADSFAFVAQNAFGLGFLTDVYTAEYDFEGQTLTLFVTRTASAADAAALQAEYVESIESFGEILCRDEGRSMFACDAAGLYDVVFVKGAYLAGVAGADDVDAAKKAAEAFHDELVVE